MVLLHNKTVIRNFKYNTHDSLYILILSNPALDMDQSIGEC